MTTPERDPIKAAQDLAASNALIVEELRRLGRYGRRNRKMIWFDILLTVALVGVGLVAGDARDSASKAQETQVQTCVSSNQTRAQAAQIWDHLFGMIRQPSTPQQEKALADIKAYVHRVYAARDCSKI